MFINIPKIWIGSNGIITFAITFSIMTLNSSNPCFRMSLFVAAIPIPKINARSNAVMIPTAGGISRLKNDVARNSSRFSKDSPDEEEMNLGNTLVATKNAIKPATKVEP